MNYSSKTFSDDLSESNSVRDRVLSVSELTRHIKIQLESRFPTVQVSGEISNLSRQSSGHVYFSLKDRHASLACVLWRSTAARINLPLKNGLQVVLSGSLKIYEPRGTYQLSVSSIFPAGLGNLHLEFERRKQKYEQLGYFSNDHKRLIPDFPRCIAIVTSSTGAVVQDIIRVINRRYSNGISLDIYPVKVQGPGAEFEIAKALGRINKRVDVDLIIFGRGGGSLEDLWAFNEPAVIESVYESTIPTISAVGHETDFTLADFVADVRAATPSVAAELAVPEVQSWRLYLDERFTRIIQELGTLLHFENQQLSRVRPANLVSKFRFYLERFHQDLDYSNQSLERGVQHKLNQSIQKFDRFQPIDRVLLRAIQHSLEQSRVRLEGALLRTIARTNLTRLKILKKLLNDLNTRSLLLSTDLIKSRNSDLILLTEQLKLSDPKNVLARGYSIIKKGDRILERAESLSIDDDVRIVMHDGEAIAKIIEKREEC